MIVDFLISSWDLIVQFPYEKEGMWLGVSIYFVSKFPRNILSAGLLVWRVMFINNNKSLTS